MTSNMIYFIVTTILLILIAFAIYYIIKINRKREEYERREKNYWFKKNLYSDLEELPTTMIKEIVEKAAKILKSNAKTFPNSDEKKISLEAKEQVDLVARILIEMDKGSSKWYFIDKEKRDSARRVEECYEKMTPESKEILHELYSHHEIYKYLREGERAADNINAANARIARERAKSEAEEQAHREKMAKEIWSWLMMNG